MGLSVQLRRHLSGHALGALELDGRTCMLAEPDPELWAKVGSTNGCDRRISVKVSESKQTQDSLIHSPARWSRRSIRLFAK